jgi:hypothetical protein
MKIAGLIPILLLAAAPAGLRAEAPAPSPVAAEAVTTSPTATPPLTAAPAKESSPPTGAELQPANAPNPDVIELPKMKVQQKKRPRLTPEVMMTTQGFNEKLATDKLSSFDRNVLNRYTLPLFGTSAADRAREEYERAKKDQLATDVLHLAKVAEVTDPAQAKALREAVSKP